MWRRACITPLRSAVGRPHYPATAALSGRGGILAPISSSSPFPSAVHLFSSESGDDSLKKRVEDVMPIATGIERAELEAELQGKKLFDTDPEGPFGTKEAPAIIKSYFDKRIVGCVGDEGEDEHEVIWFWLEKGKPHVCPICSQYFMLEVIGEGGPVHPPSDDEEEEQH